jgi:hypothetical protein
MKKLLVSLILLFFTVGCATEWESSNTSNSVSQDRRYCKAMANAAAPTYLCRNPLMCASDETVKVLDSMVRNNAYFEKCMFEKGNVPK